MKAILVCLSYSGPLIKIILVFERGRIDLVGR